MASRAQHLDADVAFPGDAERLYTACFFNRGAVVPQVQLLAANTDEEAIADLRSSHIFTTRELRDRHRLVAVIAPDDAGQRA
jgi:hypothetical protein